MAMSEIRNVAFEVQSRFETWDDAYWGCVLPHLRRTFPSMKTLSPVLLEHDQNGFDVVTGWPRQSPWLRDGSDAVGQGFEVRAAPITGLVPVRGGVRNNEVWATFSARIERLRRETPGCEGLEVVMQLAERDWTPLRKPWTNRKTPMSVNRQVLGLSSINGGSCWEPQSNWIWGHRFEMAAR
ncbi:hypothetical protein SODALDRAFT_334300 [Sodiomyces alkalinus F11]|uniref:Uncharacterized protein n=1 Tax=Sodiomyces alkalinus (strain CBS 110278 / VKM F-3762 / F11) TaxID=1314773 RepID=A0A3N2PRT1_SODAK|nr:hypothetical protein SODALDRAFT_334300 [Sodiomyces alkalinus F11]ROT37213.1 hypothetical protein SODALDRAFT_334300 [Sodiomyces alkalinus F11]